VAQLQALVEWVPDTTTLKSVIQTELKRRVLSGRAQIPRLVGSRADTREEQVNEMFNIAGLTFLNRLAAHDDKWPKETTLRDTQKALAGMTLPEIAAATKRGVVALNEMHSMFDSDLLREGALGLAASPEARLLLRQRFVTSLATLTIAGYILGACSRLVSRCHSATDGVGGWQAWVIGIWTTFCWMCLCTCQRCLCACYRWLT
jgi:hypothetical protein